ncbi:MAG: FixH family protein [Anaeromyxobacteraceae bacterium]
MLVGAGRAADFRVEVRSDRALGTGIAVLAIRVVPADGTSPADASVSFSAVHPATGLVAPLVNGPSLDAEGNWRLEASVPRPSAGTDGWSMTVVVRRPGRADAGVTIPDVPVVDRHLGGVFPSGDARYLLAVRFPAGLGAGSNPVTVALHSMPIAGGPALPVTDAAIHVEPWMPSMGHGSTGSVDPTPGPVPGVYAGSLSFSMPGDWETPFIVSRAGIELGRVAVAVYF